MDGLFAHVPGDSGLAYVVVQHLDRRRPSLLVELLRRHTPLPVTEASDGTRVEADHVYVIRPDTVLGFEGGCLRVEPSPGTRPPTTIDRLFRALARDQGERAVGVLLSGAGSDGTVGMRVIQEHGGLTVAQAPETAEHDGMPTSAIEAGFVDRVLPVERIPEAVLQHARHLVAASSVEHGELDASLVAHLPKICAILERRTGHDFSRYKQPTLLRRLRRRLQVQRSRSVDDYVTTLDEDPRETRQLLKDLLIGVTQFFRDPEAFDALATLALPDIVGHAGPEATIRAWVPGCSSGEEAYSVAMLLCEAQDRAGTSRPTQIFATDIDADAIAEARSGRYADDLEQHVSPERLARFFVREREAGPSDPAVYRVVDALREMCIFSEHSLIRDPPFTHLDLISCRNILIYLGTELQQGLVLLFHYALRPGGYLFLGPAETLAAHEGLFDTADERHRLFRSKGGVLRPAVAFPLSRREGPSPPPGPPTPVDATREPVGEASHAQLGAAFERMALDEYTAPCAVVNRQGETLLVAGRIGRFLQPPSGTLSTRLLDLVPAGLRLELRLALQAAASTAAKVVRDDVPVEVDDATVHVRLTVRPVPGIDPAQGLFAVVIQEQGSLTAPEVSERRPPTDGPAVEQLERELRETRAQLRTTVEDLASANQELRSTNEELVSSNEEIQTANEELQTSKEELQSLNEELETVNAQLQQRVEELGAANADLQNLFAATEIATLFLDRNLRIARFTPAATALFHLLESDVGRPLADLAPRFLGEDLEAVARRVLSTLAPIERQVRTAAGERWFILRVLPYRAADNRIAGAVVTFVDVSRLKQAEEALRESDEHFRLMVEAVRDYAIFMLAPDGTIASWNAGAERLKGYRADEIIGQNFARFFPAEDARSGKPERELQQAAAQGRVEDEGWRVRKDGSRFWASTVLTAIRGEDGQLRGFAKITRDFTARRSMEQALREREARLAGMFQNAAVGIVEVDQDDRLVAVNDRGLEILGYRREELLGRTVRDLTYPADRGASDVVNERIHEGSASSLGYEKRYVRRDGTPVWVYVTVSGVRDQDGRWVRSVGTFEDITERRLAQEHLERSRLGLSRLAEASLSVMRETDLTRMLEAISEAALALTGARLASCGHGFVSGRYIVGGSARAPGAPECPPGEMYVFDKGGVHLALVEGAESIRLTDAELRAHAKWWGLPEGHVPMRGLLGVRMQARNGKTNGMILVTDKEQGDFTPEDEVLLRQLATVATLALQHVEARISLEEADRQKNQFLAMLSHELRNPLAPISNSLYILERASDAAQAKRAKAVIDRQVAHLTRLVDDLLDVTRISRGKIRLQRERVDLRDLARKAVEDYRDAFARNRVALELSLPDETLWIDADRTRIAQVIGNLLGNAAKFTPPGGRTSVTVEARPAGFATVRVRDTGIGIEPDMLPRVFEAFSQADTTLDRSRGGLGLGLAMVKGLVDMHGGTASVASPGLNEGTEFTVQLPLAASPADEAFPTGRAGSGRSRRVLVIEDNVDAAESLREVLEFLQHTAEVAFSGADGLDKARTFRPDIVLCDIGLPGMDGYEVARAIRADPKLRGLRLVALSGYAAPEDIARAREAGFDAHLAKPPALEQLEALLAGADTSALL